MYDKNNLDEFLKLLGRFDIHLCPDPEGKWVNTDCFKEVMEINNLMIVSTKEEKEVKAEE